MHILVKKVFVKYTDSQHCLRHYKRDVMNLKNDINLSEMCECMRASDKNEDYRTERFEEKYFYISRLSTWEFKCLFLCCFFSLTAVSSSVWVDFYQNIGKKKTYLVTVTPQTLERRRSERHETCGLPFLLRAEPKWTSVLNKINK